jgi:glucose-6-phosphate isomerase
MANQLAPLLTQPDKPLADNDSSTDNLIAHYRQGRGRS